MAYKLLIFVQFGFYEEVTEGILLYNTDISIVLKTILKVVHRMIFKVITLLLHLLLRTPINKKLHIHLFQERKRIRFKI